MSAEPDIEPVETKAEAPVGRIRLWIPALLMAVIVGGLWAPNLLRPPPPAWTVYKNVKGQIRRVVLTDKSVLRLNGASQVSIVYEDDDRLASIGETEAAFTMTPDEDRPFVIESGDRVIRMDGGEINILREAGSSGAETTLTIRDGHAWVYPRNQAAEGVTAGPNQEVSWTDGQPGPKVRTVNAANAFAWESHKLAYDKAPLSEVAADLNRYVARPIRIDDPQIAALPFSGVLTLEGEDAMLRRISAVLPVQAVQSEAAIVLQRPRPKPLKKPNALVQSLLKLETGPPARALPKPRPPAKPASSAAAPIAPPTPQPLR